jgi:adenylosuccinate synthase
MRNVKVVIGANFGDEGKGLMTDYFCSQFPKEERVLNVRFNGGAQAGHTVVSPDGRRHIFGHFGAGSFLPNVATYLGPDFIVNPILFRREYEKLRRLGVYPMVYCHPRCMFTMPQDMMMNQFIEKRRGNDRHGSCGVGIFETIMREKKNYSVIRADNCYLAGIAHVAFQPDFGYFDCERMGQMIGDKLTEHEKALMINQNIRAHFNQDARFFMDHVSVCDESILDAFDNVVFEGAQGLMLDQNNLDYFPHLTPSNTGVQNVIPWITDDMDVEVCYVSRTYVTRHGAGPLPGECPREMIGAGIDLTNHENEWQGELRYGKLDLQAMIKRCVDDARKLGEKDNLYWTWAMTHCDEVAGFTEEEKAYILPFINHEHVLAPRYKSYGPTRKDVRIPEEGELKT